MLTPRVHTATLRYPKSDEDKTRHCYWTCLMTRVCGPGTALGISSGFEHLDIQRFDPGDLEANRRGVVVAYTSLFCDDGCETCEL